MDPNLVLLERTERVATIVLNRPEKRNALSPSLLTQFTDALNRIREEGEVRCLVIRGAGEKAFCAGFDISEFPSTFNIPPPITAILLLTVELFRVSDPALSIPPPSVVWL